MCTNTDFRSKVSSKFTLSLLLNREMYVSPWARPISLIYDARTTLEKVSELDYA